MTLTALDCAAHIEHTLSGPMSMLSVLDVVNQTGQHMVGMHQWMFLKRPSVRLAARASITLEGATWTESTKTLTKTGAFSSYTFLAGDQARVTDGTGATTGFYRIASKTSANAIVLETSIGSGADAQTDIDGTLTLSSCALPSDFGGILSIKAGVGLQDLVIPATLEEIENLRSDPISQTGSLYLAALAWGQLAVGGAPVPRLEIWPEPSAADAEKFRLSYRAAWQEVATEGQVLAIPTHVEALYVTLLRAFARGYEEEDQGTLSQRLAEIEVGPVFMAAKKYDGSQQRSYGPMRGGWLQRGSVDPFGLKPRALGGAS